MSGSPLPVALGGRRTNPPSNEMMMGSRLGEVGGCSYGAVTITITILPRKGHHVVGMGPHKC